MRHRGLCALAQYLVVRAAGGGYLRKRRQGCVPWSEPVERRYRADQEFLPYAQPGKLPRPTSRRVFQRVQPYAVERPGSEPQQRQLWGDPWRGRPEDHPTRSEALLLRHLTSVLA